MVTRLTDEVWWIDLGGVNAYLVDDGDALTLVDAGMPWHADRLERAIRTVGDAVGAVDRVLITHFDFDHVGALDRLPDLDATLYVGIDDEPYLAGRETPTWNSAKGLFQRVTAPFRDGPTQPVDPVSDGETIGGFTAVHTPGHTPGHTAFVHEELSVAFLGDLVRERDGAFERPPRFLNADHDEAGRSIATFVERAPDFEMACPGHGRPIVDGGAAALARCADAFREDPEKQ